YSYFFFFFQAEDGIRDFHVTGVQTCALPISSTPSLRFNTFSTRLEHAAQVMPAMWMVICFVLAICDPPFISQIASSRRSTLQSPVPHRPFQRHGRRNVSYVVR